MARQVTNDGSPHLAITALAINSHLEPYRSTTTHADGPDYDPMGVLLAPASSPPATLDECLVFQNAAKVWWNVWHLPLAGLGGAHKVADAANLIAAADSPSASSLYATWLAAMIAGAAEMTTAYLAHIGNSGGAFHTTADTANVVGSSGTMTTASDLCERLNLLKSLHNLHIVLLSLGGTVHGASGAADAVTTANAVDTDWDSIIALHNALQLKLAAHWAQAASIHPGGADARTLTSPAGTYPSTLFAMLIEWKTRVNAHFPSTTYHGVADATTLGYANPTTVATVKSATILLHTALRAHFFLGPGAGLAEGLRIIAP